MVWFYMWWILPIFIAIEASLIYNTCKDIKKYSWKEGWDLGDKLLALAPIFLLLLGFHFQEDVCIDTVQTWQEQQGFLGTTTSNYALINGEYEVRLSNPFQAKEGECITIHHGMFEGWRIT